MHRKGFTLIELLAVLAVLTITVGFGYPQLAHFIQKIKASSATNGLLNIINFTRIQAVTGGKAITLCPTPDGITCTSNWDNTLYVFSDTNWNKKIDANETIYRVQERNINYQLVWKGWGGQYYLRYQPDGTTYRQNGTFTLCTENKEYIRAIIINRGGRPLVARDANNDGIIELPENKTPLCS
ncbi:GspH/FimT family pseudopilin [Hahella aquimaris]|uniref:GspH/FimT family pseudopilin n=1 Tax=Hahella sp. HNIBRBA332 TaxID=3015983 RepID=UPI00273C78B5|nr:GspH/FimT family pseudopilin [Hahella sp. HNIBRBA332]WLQ14061.1 GspH/FimT family pseudopilin [Hahella sp. HNIBRBA332]